MRTTVILKTDIVNSTPKTAQLTQSEMGLQRKQHKRFISEIVRKNEGAVFQEDGDAYWIQFPSVTTAVPAAIELHQALRTSQTGKSGKQRLAIRAIVTVGDILYQDNDTIGMTMSLTARIEKITPPDEIYLSHAAWLILNHAEVQTSFVGEFQLKGFNEPQMVYKVDQKYRTHVLTDQYILFTDAKGFTSFIKSTGVEQVERFLLECDDLINDVCEKHNGVIRQVNGDQYFITFNDGSQTLAAIQELCEKWKGIFKRYGVGVSMAVHNGNLSVIRSFVYGDDIHATVYLSQFDKFYDSKPGEIWVTTSGKVKNELRGTSWEGQFQELDSSRLTEEKHLNVFQQYGVFRLRLD